MNTAQVEIANGAKEDKPNPKMVVEYDPKTRGFKIGFIDGSIPHNELIGLLERIKLNLCMQADMAAVQAQQQQSAQGIEVANAMPPAQPKLRR